MTDKIYLKDIAGYDEEKAEAKKIIEVLRNYKKYEEIGAYVPKGLILSGNPGVGKTMLAKAIANESGVPFYELNVNEGKNESETVKIIKEIFAKAKQNKPSIIFIDELDELVITINFRSDSTRKITKALLTEIDGISSSDGVLVIATTNDRSLLPEPITRSGRMDKRITMGLPDTIDREEIFKLYLDKNKLLSNIDPHQLALKTSGFSGADIKTLVNETIIDCTSKDIKTIGIKDFERNIPVVMFQDINKKSRTGPNDMICYHEIGHFITEYIQTGNIGSISIQKHGKVQGHVSLEIEDYLTVVQATRNTLHKKLVTILGGMAGEEIMCLDVGNGSSNDIMKARRLIYALMNTGAFGFDKLPAFNSLGGMVGDGSPSSLKKMELIEEFEINLLNKAYEDAKNIIRNNKELNSILYEELKQRETLSKQDAEQLVNEYNKKGK